MDYGSQVALIEKVGEGGGQKCIDHLTGQVTVLSLVNGCQMTDRILCCCVWFD